MNIPITIFLFCSASSLCFASEREVTAVPTGNQVLQYDRGAPFVLSNGRNTRASLSIEVISKSEARLWFGVFNGQEVPITVFAEGASAVSDGKPLQIFGVVELTKKLKRKSMWERIGAGAAAGANSYTASQQGRTTSESTHSGTINNYRSGGNTSLDYRGRTTTRTDDPIARRQVQESAITNNSEMLGNLRATQAREASALNDSVFQTQTILPRGTYVGFLQLELPRKSGTQTTPIEVSLIAGPDTHRYFLFLDAAPTQQQQYAIASIGITEAKGRNKIWTEYDFDKFGRQCIAKWSKLTQSTESRGPSIGRFCRCLADGIQEIVTADEFNAIESSEASWEEMNSIPHFWDVQNIYGPCKEQFDIP